MTTKKILNKQFSKIPPMEQKMVDFYSYFGKTIKDEYISKTMLEILEDEKKHLKLANRLLELVS
ncbi:MAG: hypothetical protein ABIB65_01430 [Candidatus Margulisiibacteriota bacterium]